MTITSTSTGRADRETGQAQRRKNRTLWAAQVLLAAVFAFGRANSPARTPRWRCRPDRSRAVAALPRRDPELAGAAGLLIRG